MTEDRYTGYKNLIITDDDLAQLYTSKTLTNSEFSFLENEYLGVYSEEGNLLDTFIYKEGKFLPVKRKDISSRFGGIVKPLNPEQVFAFNMLKDEQIAIKLITGCFGSGKTMALVAGALEALEKNKFEKIIWVRNNVQVKNTDPLGALPGTEFEKMLPYLGPMMDHVGGPEGIRMLIEKGQLEVIPLAYLRGRSIKNSIIISSEAENLTKEHIQLLMGRVDKGSALWMDADLKQRDREVFEKSAGIETMIDRLKGEPLFGYVHLVKSERSEAARLADKLN